MPAQRWLAVTTSPRAYHATSRVFAGEPRIHVALGLHPEVAEAKAGEERLLVQLIANSPLIGELGLDGSSRFRQSLAVQKRIFTAAIAECERQGGRGISIHSRGAASAVLDVLDAHPRCGKPVLHWFTGSERELARAITWAAGSVSDRQCCLQPQGATSLRRCRSIRCSRRQMAPSRLFKARP